MQQGTEIDIYQDIKQLLRNDKKIDGCKFHPCLVYLRKEATAPVCWTLPASFRLACFPHALLDSPSEGHLSRDRKPTTYPDSISKDLDLEPNEIHNSSV